MPQASKLECLPLAVSLATLKSKTGACAIKLITAIIVAVPK